MPVMDPSPMVTGAVAEMPGTPLPTDQCICPHLALYPCPAQGAWRALAPDGNRRGVEGALHK